MGKRFGTAKVVSEKRLALPGRVKAGRPTPRRRVAASAVPSVTPDHYSFHFDRTRELLSWSEEALRIRGLGVESLHEEELVASASRGSDEAFLAHLVEHLKRRLWMAVHQLSYEPRAPDLAFEVSVPLPMRSNVDGQGGRGWWDRYRLVRQQHDLVENAFLRHSREVTALTSSRSRGYTVRLTRIAKDAGDDDNAASAVKGIRDAVAKILCIDDGAAAIRFLPVGQEVEEKLEVPRVRIEIWLSQEICSACKQHVAPRRKDKS